MFKLTEERNKKGTPLAKVVMQTISDVMNTDDKVVMLEADLAGASSSTIIEKLIRTDMFSAVLLKLTWLASLRVYPYRDSSHSFILSDHSLPDVYMTSYISPVPMPSIPSMFTVPTRASR